MVSSVILVSAGLGLISYGEGIRCEGVSHHGLEGFLGRQSGECSLALPFHSAQSAFPKRFVLLEAR